MGKAIGKGIEVVETFLKELDKPPKAAVKVIKTQGVHDTDVNMSRGGAMPKKTTVMEDIQSLGDPAAALADMLAGAARGTTAAATGFYGDMEDLVRKYGKGLPANVIRALLPTREGKETLLPTVEEMNAMLPPAVPKGASRSAQVGQTYNDLGVANPLAPTAIGAVKPIAKAVGPVLKAGALDLATSRPMQEAVEQLGALTGAGPMYATPKEMRAVRSAGRKEFKKQAPERAQKDAEVAALLASLPARDRAANEAAGLYHQVGGGLKLDRPVHGMHSTTVPDPAFNPPAINIITPEQLVKEEAALIPLVGDRAAGGRYLTHIGENELAEPVRLTGGPLYMDANYNPVDPAKSAVWESGSGRVTALNNAAARAGAGGRPVYGVYTAGSGTNTDFNVMGANALLQQLPFSNITPEAAHAFDQAMREESKQFPAIKDWPGVLSPEAIDLVLDKSNGILRTKLLGTAEKQNFQSMGFPNVAATRKAIIEPELLDVPTNQAGFRLARMDPTGRLIENPQIPSDYPTAMAGQVAGKLDVPADYKDIWQSYFDARRLFSQPTSGDYRSFSLAHPFQIADDEWLNKLMEKRLADELRIKQGSYAEGGEVDMADGGSADFFIDPSAYAQAKSKEMYPKKKSEWTEQDAARHMLAAGMMAQKFGPTAAKVAGLAHEHFNAPVKTLGYALGIGKLPADYEQDLHNNALGIDLAKRAANQAELERLVREATGKSSKTQTPGTPWIGEPKNAARLSDY